MTSTSYVLPPQPLPSVAPPGAYAGNSQAVIQWQIWEGQDAAYVETQRALQDFYTKWKNWFIRYDSGQGRTDQPPTPPLSFSAHITVRTNDDGGFQVDADSIQDGPPVCDPPQYDKLPGDPSLIPASSTTEVAGPSGLPPVGAIITLPPDGFPIGTTLVVNGGMVITKRSMSMGPFGTSIYWQRTA